MHETASIAGRAFAETYGYTNHIVIDIGGLDVNGSLRSFFESNGMKYICIDMNEHSSVDIVVKPYEKLPFNDGSIDLIVSTSCFEHDPCFWMTFKEMTRIIKLNGYIYLNAPTSGPYHTYPGDNWRFYSDCGQALAYWSCFELDNKKYPVKVIETFNILGDIWNDFVCIWMRVDETTTDILINTEILNNIGKLEKKINDYGYNTRKKC